MKNQYFGDNRDLFKYDLIYQLARASLVDNITFIPMLTAPDNTGHGGQTDRRKARVGARNKALVRFLDRCVAEGKRDIRQLESFFDQYSIKVEIYEDNFLHQRRKEYFTNVGNELVARSLIFVDPDVGLEVGRRGEKHILYSEVKNLYEGMDEHSVLMIYQHFPRENHIEYLHRRVAELTEKICGEAPICIDNDEVIFFFLTRNETLEESLAHLISDYAESYS